MDIHRRSPHTYRNAMAYMFKSDPEQHLANVLLEDDLCISCFFQVAQPTSRAQWTDPGPHAGYRGLGLHRPCCVGHTACCEASWELGHASPG